MMVNATSRATAGQNEELPPYAFWSRLQRLQAALPAERTGVAVWASVFVLSVVAFVLAAA